MAAPVIRITPVSCFRYASTPLQQAAGHAASGWMETIARTGRTAAGPAGKRNPAPRRPTRLLQLPECDTGGISQLSPLQGLGEGGRGGRECSRDFLHSLHHFQPHIPEAGGAMRHGRCCKRALFGWQRRFTKCATQAKGCRLRMLKNDREQRKSLESGRCSAPLLSHAACCAFWHVLALDPWASFIGSSNRHFMH